MHFAPSIRAQDYLQRLGAFMQEHVLPAEAKYCGEVQNVADWRTWKQPSTMEELKAKARSAGLWNLFLPEKE
jgi:acyl-CoA dehydrogenase